jgi:hypothetical protein
LQYRILKRLTPHRGEWYEKKIFFYAVFSGIYDRIVYSGKNLTNSGARCLRTSANTHHFIDISDKLFESEALFGSVGSACCLSELHRPQYQRRDYSSSYKLPLPK